VQHNLAISFLVVTTIPTCAAIAVHTPGHGFHEHLVQVYGHCVVEGRQGIVMELCSLDLSTYLWQRTRGILGTDEVLHA
jgi:hypothetical protein